MLTFRLKILFQYNPVRFYFIFICFVRYSFFFVRLSSSFLTIASSVSFSLSYLFADSNVTGQAKALQSRKIAQLRNTAGGIIMLDSFKFSRTALHVLFHSWESIISHLILAGNL